MRIGPVVSWLRQHPGFVAAVIAPTLAAGVYWGGIASNQYVSESMVTVRQSSDTINAAAGLASLFGHSDGGDIYMLESQITSLDMLMEMEKELGVRKLWTSRHIDYLSKLSDSATQEEFVKYFKKHVTVDFDESHGVLLVKVKGFSPDQALMICRFVLAKGEKYINDLSHKIAEEQVDFVRKELALAEEKYQAAAARMVEFQNKHHLLDPINQAKAISTIAVEIQAQITKAEAELNASLAYLSPTAPQIVAQKTKLQALRTQLDKELGSVVGGGNPKLNALAVQFREMELAAGFAENNLKAVRTALEQTRVESAKKLKHVVVVTSPHPAQESEYPKRLQSIAGVFLASLLLYGAGRMAISTIQDHRG